MCRENAAEPETPASPEVGAAQNAGTPESGAPEEEPAGDETKVLPSIRGKGVFGGKKRAKEEPVPEPEADEGSEDSDEDEKRSMNPLKLIDDLIYDRSKHKPDGSAEEPEPVDDDEDEPLEERDYMPIRTRRDGQDRLPWRSDVLCLCDQPERDPCLPGLDGRIRRAGAQQGIYGEYSHAAGEHLHRERDRREK